MAYVAVHCPIDQPISRVFSLISLEDVDPTDERIINLKYLHTTITGWAVIEVRIAGGFRYYPSPLVPPHVSQYLADFFNICVPNILPATVIPDEEVIGEEGNEEEGNERAEPIFGHITYFGDFFTDNEDGTMLLIPFGLYQPLTIDHRKVNSLQLTPALVALNGDNHIITQEEYALWIHSHRHAIEKFPHLLDLFPGDRPESLKAQQIIDVTY